jgi:uncharacterized membrane protein
MDETAIPRGGSILQFARRSGFHSPGLDYRNSRWQWQLEGQRLKGILLMHLVFGCVSTAMIWAVSLVHLRAKRSPGAVPPAYRVALEVIGVVLVTFTGHLGGFLSGVNGPG